jgi:excisionase family DNA binding protein
MRISEKKKMTNDPIVPQKLLRATEVAEILNVSRAFAYQLMQRGKIRTVAIGSARRVRLEDLQTFIEVSLEPSFDLRTAR